MKWSNGGYFRLLLCVVLLCAGASLCFPQASGPTLPLPSQEQNILTLKEKLTQALELCQNLQISLQLRLASYNQLTKDYEALNSKLESLQQTISTSETNLLQAQADLAEMQKLLVILQDSLKQASKSLAAYKSDTEKAVRAVEMQRDGWKVFGITFGIAATGEAVYIIGRALKAW